MANRSKRPPGEALVDLRRRLALLSPRDLARSEVIARAAEAYGVSIWTIYRALREPIALHAQAQAQAQGRKT